MDRLEDTMMECGRALASLEDGAKKGGLQRFYNMLQQQQQKESSRRPLSPSPGSHLPPYNERIAMTNAYTELQGCKKEEFDAVISAVRNVGENNGLNLQNLQKGPGLKLSVDIAPSCSDRGLSVPGMVDSGLPSSASSDASIKAESMYEGEEITSPEGTISLHSQSFSQESFSQYQEDNSMDYENSGLSTHSQQQEKQHQQQQSSSSYVSEMDNLSYQCAACQKKFMHFRAYEIHFRRHLFGPLSCIHCRVQYLNISLLRMHICCKETIAQLNKSTVTPFVSIQPCPKKYTCHQCYHRPMFSKLVELKRHMRNKHDSWAIQPMKCNECQNVFSDTASTINYCVEDTQLCCNFSEMFECKMCCAKFVDVSSLSKHQFSEHTFPVPTFTTPTVSDLSTPFMCTRCGKTFGRKTALQRHRSVHTDMKPQLCPYCDFTCREISNLHRHLDYHFARRRFVCEICGAAFHAKKTLETHHTYKHTDTKNFCCGRCGMAFKTRNSLQRHMRTHNSVKEHQCMFCPMAFHRFYNLRRHVTIVHRQTQVFPPIRRLAVLRNTKTEQPMDAMKVEGDMKVEDEGEDGCADNMKTTEQQRSMSSPTQAAATVATMPPAAVPSLLHASHRTDPAVLHPTVRHTISPKLSAPVFPPTVTPPWNVNTDVPASSELPTPPPPALYRAPVMSSILPVSSYVPSTIPPPPAPSSALLTPPLTPDGVFPEIHFSFPSPEPQRAGGVVPHQQMHNYTTTTSGSSTSNSSYDVPALFYSNTITR